MPHAGRTLRLVVLAVLLLAGMAHGESRLERGYRNGRPFRIRVTTVGPADVEVQTARAFTKMARAAQKAGVALVIRSGFRSHERQKELFRAWREGWGNRAARPGFSNHESGRALDIDLDRDGTFAWLTKNGRKFGFRRTVPGEPWHWEFQPSVTARASSTRRRS
jgi:LAS superfamily LD-carboxypeptidase LdcB